MNSSHGGGTALNQSLMHSKYVGDNATHFNTTSVKIDCNLRIVRNL